MARATLRGDRYVAHAPEPAGEPSTLLERLSERDTVLVGLDLPIGVPASYAQRAGVESFLEWLPSLGSGEWAEFYSVAERQDQVSVHRPFYPRSPLPKGSKKREHLLRGLGVASMNDLLRRCDLAHDNRREASSIFWLVGGNQVGKAAMSGWRDVLAPALRSPDLDVAVWPFDGALAKLLGASRITVVETYPTEFYGHLGIEFSPSRTGQKTGKRVPTERRKNAPVLFEWASANDVDLTPDMRAAIQGGFGPRADGEDSFDATVGLFGMLNVVLGRQPPGEPTEPSLRKIEGWMLGQLPQHTASLTPTTKPESRERPVPPGAEPPAEYDPLADFYDLEYTHDYDLPFWLSLAGREGGPIVEWGAGTGRLSVPLARAGFDVTAVEFSENMVEKGREKNAPVEWVPGDMRTIELGRQYRLAVCAFNSFLCLRTVDDALAALRNARDHLSPDGLLGIEVSAFSPEELAEEPGGPALRLDLTRTLPHGDLKRFSISRYDAATQLLSMSLFYEVYGVLGELETRRAHELVIRVVGLGELDLMLRLSGFEIEAVYGGFEGEPFESGSDHLVVLARPL